MGGVKIVLIGSATVFGTVWLAVLICALCDRLEGRGRIDPDGEQPRHAPPIENPAPLPWWKRILIAPWLALLMGLLFTIFFPMLLLEVPYRLVEMILGPKQQPNG